MIPPKKNGPDARDFAVAVMAAVIDDQRAEWVPRLVMEDGKPVRSRPDESFTRAHVDALRRSGATKAEALDYARDRLSLSTQHLEKFASDLDSYGIWTGG